jgi:hypothetical protein
LFDFSNGHHDWWINAGVHCYGASRNLDRNIRWSDTKTSRFGNRFLGFRDERYVQSLVSYEPIEVNSSHRH